MASFGWDDAHGVWMMGDGEHSRPTGRQSSCRRPFLLPVTDEASHTVFAHTGQRPIARCRWCASCIRIAEREWIASIDEAARSTGGYTGYLVLSISRRTFDRPEDGFILLYRCFDLFMKRLRHIGSWRGYVKRLEAGSRSDFPHLNVLFFGWKFLHKATIHRVWSDVTLEVTGVAARCDRISAVSMHDLGRLSRYTFKEALTGVSSYTWKEGRPMWLPKHRRMWSKSKRCGVRAWPARRDREAAKPLTDGGTHYAPWIAGAMAAHAGSRSVRGPIGQGSRRGPPGQLAMF